MLGFKTKKDEGNIFEQLSLRSAHRVYYVWTPKGLENLKAPESLSLRAAPLVRARGTSGPISVRLSLQHGFPSWWRHGVFAEHESRVGLSMVGQDVRRRKEGRWQRKILQPPHWRWGTSKQINKQLHKQFSKQTNETGTGKETYKQTNKQAN